FKYGWEVILAVNTSVIEVGYTLLQLGEDGKCYPNQFGSITLNKVESCYSQVKLELYVKLDVKYVKGMINNPDLQPNATINQWIAGILLFLFKLVHIPADKHAGPDGLSCRPWADADPPVLDDHEDWLDAFYSFAIAVIN
ncbi:hypothetical protein PAXRUDRAFT_38767, partial [Paxillus rubicundulus Ve08.2h10]